MTQIIASQKTEFAIDPVILDLLPEQGSIELQHDAAGKVHRFHTHPVDEILVIISGRLNFMWDGGERIVGAGDTIHLPAGTLAPIRSAGGRRGLRDRDPSARQSSEQLKQGARAMGVKTMRDRSTKGPSPPVRPAR